MTTPTVINLSGYLRVPCTPLCHAARPRWKKPAMRMSTTRILLPTFAVAGTLTLAGCGSGSPAPSTSTSTAASSTAAFTAQDGTQACNDLNAWLPGAMNVTQPRFNDALTADENAAQGTQLGDDLTTLDNNLQDLNGLALMPNPPGYAGPPTGLAGLQQDCADYGVSIKMPGS